MPLGRDAATWRCATGHSFDVARSGYVNLLQPQDRRSLEAGDPRAALEARARLLTAGIGRGILDAFVTQAADLLSDGVGTIVDLGCGRGDALSLLHQRRDSSPVGIDLAVSAVDAAARRFPALTWVVANADRRLPLLDARASLVLSLHARRNPQECHRILADEGHLLVAVPAPEDLVELREAAQGEPVERDRVAAVIDEHEPFFDVVQRTTATERHVVNGEQARDLLQGTYRVRTRALERIDPSEPLHVTLASDFIVLRRRLAPGARA